jgi:hypothetical protein
MMLLNVSVVNERSGYKLASLQLFNYWSLLELGACCRPAALVGGLLTMPATNCNSSKLQ